jgi:hypothetical protein
MEKVVPIKQLQYERMYRTFYSDIRNKEFNLRVWFSHKDQINKAKIG